MGFIIHSYHVPSHSTRGLSPSSLVSLLVPAIPGFINATLTWSFNFNEPSITAYLRQWRVACGMDLLILQLFFACGDIHSSITSACICQSSISRSKWPGSDDPDFCRKRPALQRACIHRTLHPWHLLFEHNSQCMASFVRDDAHHLAEQTTS